MKKFLKFAVLVLSLIPFTGYTGQQIYAVGVSSCDASQYDFTREYTQVGPLATTSCYSWDCETKRRPLIGTGNYEFTCWSKGSAPAGTNCPGNCSAGPPFTCEQAGCVPVTQASRGGGVCTSCQVPAPQQSLQCGDFCNDNSECPSECGSCTSRSGGARKTCGGIPHEPIPVYDPTCASGGPYGINYGGVKTALGCLPTEPQAFINTATPWAVRIGAGIAFLLGIFGAVMIVLSAGNPEKMQAGKEMITSAVGGLILIIFAVFILRVIGVDVLKLF